MAGPPVILPLVSVNLDKTGFHHLTPKRLRSAEVLVAGSKECSGECGLRYVFRGKSGKSWALGTWGGVLGNFRGDQG